MTDLFLKISGAFFTLKVLRISSTYNDGFTACLSGDRVKHVQRINNIFKLILHGVKTSVSSDLIMLKNDFRLIS